MASRIGTYMENHGCKFVKEAVPVKLEKPDPNGQVIVTYQQDGQVLQEQYDTVLFAVGRYAVTEGINLQNIGIKPESNWKLKVNDEE